MNAGDYVSFTYQGLRCFRGKILTTTYPDSNTYLINPIEYSESTPWKWSDADARFCNTYIPNDTLCWTVPKRFLKLCLTKKGNLICPVVKNVSVV